jgi:hypothetical protein
MSAMGQQATRGKVSRSATLNGDIRQSQARDTALEIIGIFIWQDMPLPLD